MASQSKTPTLRRSLFQVAIWATLLVLSLGLPRLLVVCSGPHADRHIEFAHAAGGCCAPVVGADAADRCCGHEDCGENDCGEGDCGDSDGSDDARAGHGGCVDVALGGHTGPMPERVRLDRDTPVGALPPPAYERLWVVVPTAGVRPFSTGPPRPDPRTGRLATTRLLI